LHYENALPNLKINPNKDVFRQAVGDWIRDKDRNESDVVAIYYSGHGDIELDRHYLLTAESDPQNLLDTAVPTEDLARRIASSSVRLVLLLIDTCYAGGGSADIAKVVSGIRGLFSKENVGFFVIAAARPKEEARQGVFAEALTSVFSDERLAGALQEFLLPMAVSTAINRYFRNKNLSQLTMAYETYVGYEDPPFFPNPRYQPSMPIGVDLKTQWRISSMEPADTLVHWGPRGRGVEIESQAGWYFTGRTSILRELVRWLRTPAADAVPQVITGGPGVGKSALLARLVTVADPEYRRQAPLGGVDPDTIPPESCIDVAIHAKGKTLGEIVRAISRAIGADTEDADELVRDLAGRLEPVTIVIDALDEAKEPETIADKVLRPMTTLPTIQLLIGTRNGPVARLGPHIEIRYLDREYYESQDICDYVKLRLLARDEPGIVTPYRDKADLAGKVAEVVAGSAKTVFLIARLICENLIQAGETVDPQSEEWCSRLPNTVASAFGDYLKRFGVEESRVRELLSPLAYAEDEGLPWDNLWAPLASALSGRAYTDDDVVWVRDMAGAYIVEALKSGQSVYRLYHQALADYFHEDALNKERHRRITEALIASVPDTGAEGRKMWQEAHLYVLQHLSTHAERGGTLSSLVRDPLFLLVADPVRLLAAIDRSISMLPSEIVRVYKRTVHRLQDAPFEEKASYLELNARKQGVFDIAEQIASLVLVRRWVPKWTSWTYSGTHRVLEGHTGSVNCVALGKLGEREVVVSGGVDETVRVWEPSTGEALQVLKGHTHQVVTVALGQLGEREVIVSGSGDNTVRVWEPSTGKVLGVLAGHTDWVQSVALGRLGEREVIVSGGRDRTVRVWDASTGEALQVFKGRTSWVTSVALGQLGGRDIVVSGGWDKRVRVWEPSTGKLLRVLKGHTDWVQSVALGRLGEREVIVSGGDDRTVRVWEASTGQALQVLKGHTSYVASVALGQLGDREVIVSGGKDNKVRVWEASTGKVLQVLETDTGVVYCVALGQLRNREVVVSAGEDLRIWDVSAGYGFQVPTGRPGSVQAIALGQLGDGKVVVSGGVDGTVRVWDASTGKALRVLEGHTGHVRSVALRQLGGQEIVVSGGDDKTVRVWKASTGKALRVLRGHTNNVMSVALGQLGGRDVIVSGGWDQMVRVWEASTGEVLHVLKIPLYNVYSVALGQLGGREVVVSVSTDSTVRVSEPGRKRFLWWGKTLQVVRALGHLHVMSVALGQLGGRDVIVSGGLDRTVRVWEASTGKALQVLKAHTDSVYAVAPGKLGEREVIVSGGDDKTVRVWELEPEKIWAPIFMDASVNAITLNGPDIVVGTTGGIAVLQLKE
jgi:WD40 repeat protein